MSGHGLAQASGSPIEGEPLYPVEGGDSPPSEHYDERRRDRGVRRDIITSFCGATRHGALGSSARANPGDTGD